MLIRSLHVQNFRSLLDVRIGQLSELVVLYGDNDTGKSNLLAFLEIMFAGKYVDEVTVLSSEDQVTRRLSTPFWRGSIDGFTDNFFRNSDMPITFQATIRFAKEELVSLPEATPGFVASLPPRSPLVHLALEGEIRRAESDTATMQLTRAVLASKLFFDSTLSGTSQYLPGFKGVNSADSKEVFDSLMAQLTNSFFRIPADRYVTEEVELGRSESVPLEASTFKNWLFRTLTDRDAEALFQTISTQFNSQPFNKGRISVARLPGDLLEVFVQDQTGLKLPIGRKGSGIQQIMLILAFMLAAKARLIGIEELEINLSPATQADVFNELFRLVKSSDSPVSQLFLTTHSPYIGIRNDATRRGVWLVDGETRVAKPTSADVRRFFRSP